jgi:hypothetical protein
MVLCILCEDSKIDLVRERATKLFKESVLKVKVSPTGEEPLTHWFCEMNVSERGYKKLLLIQEDSIMELSNKFDFLDKYGLKIIK